MQPMEEKTVLSKTRRSIAIAAIVLAAVAVSSLLWMGAAFAQDAQPFMPGGGMWGGHMGYGMRPPAPEEDIAPYGYGPGWMGGMMRGIVPGDVVTGTTGYGYGYGRGMMHGVPYEMMPGMMMGGIWAGDSVTDTVPFDCPYGGMMHGMPYGMMPGMMGGMAGPMMHGMMMGGYHSGMQDTWCPMLASPEAQLAPSTDGEDLTPEDVEIPEAVESALGSADLGRGEQLASALGCISCHSLDPKQAAVAPAWYNMGETAAARIPGASAEAYLYQSIADPNAFIVPGYHANLMPQTYDQVLNDQDVANLIAYLLAQSEQ
jgi:cytochrome c551/c552